MSSGRPNQKRKAKKDKRLTRTESEVFRRSRNSLAIRKGLTAQNQWIFVPAHPNSTVIFNDAIRNAFSCGGEFFSNSTELTAAQEQIKQAAKSLQLIKDVEERYDASRQAETKRTQIQQDALKTFIRRTVFATTPLDDETFERYYSALAHGWDQNVVAPLSLLARGPLEDGFAAYLESKPADERPITSATAFSLSCNKEKSAAQLTFEDNKFIIKSQNVDLTVKVAGFDYPNGSSIDKFSIPIEGTVSFTLELDPTKENKLGFQVQHVDITAVEDHHKLLTNLIDADMVPLIGDVIEEKIEAEIAKDIEAVRVACDWYHEYLKLALQADAPGLMLPSLVQPKYGDENTQASYTDSFLDAANNKEKLATLAPKIQDALAKYKAVNDLRLSLEQTSEKKPSTVMKIFSQKLEEVTQVLTKRRDNGVEKFFKMLLTIVSLGLKKWNSKGSEVVSDIKSFISQSVFSSKVAENAVNEPKPAEPGTEPPLPRNRT